MLSIKDLAFSYKDNEVLKDISFELDKGETIALLGRNGSGKTTLLKLILGFLTPKSGNILFDDKDLNEVSLSERAKRIAYIPQAPEFVYPFTVLECTVMGRAPALSPFSRPNSRDYEIAKANLKALGLEKLEHKSINKLSGGERQLVLIARALSQDAAVLILDEPTSALDYSNQLLVLEKIEELKKSGYSILFSTHNPEQALMISSSILAIKDGVSYQYRRDELLDGKILSELYSRELCITEIDTGLNRRLSCLPK